jgi:hypothetical protein
MFCREDGTPFYPDWITGEFERPVGECRLPKRCLGIPLIAHDAIFANVDGLELLTRLRTVGTGASGSAGLSA